MRLVLIFVSALVTLVNAEQKISWTDLMSYGQTILMTRMRDLQTALPHRESIIKIQLDESQANNLKNLTEKFLDKVKQIITGNDPFDYAGLTIDYNGYGVIFKVSGKNLIISGFSSFLYNNLQVVQGEQLKFGLDLIFSGLQVTGLYDINSNVLSMFPVYGNGTFGVKLKNLEINLLANIEQTISSNILQITNAQYGVTFEGTKVDLKNVYYRSGLSKLITDVANDLASGTITTGSEGIRLLNSLITSEVNSLMMTNEITLDIIIKFIKAII